jgi:AraC-like DNA-binding protein
VLFRSDRVPGRLAKAREQDTLAHEQFPPSIAVPETRARRYYPGYSMPMSVRRFSGALRAAPPGDCVAILYANAGRASAEGARSPIAAPFLAAIRSAWSCSEDTEGWLAAFHPRIINQEFADWPAIRATAAEDPLMERDIELLDAILGRGPGGAPGRPLLLDPEETIFLNRLFSGMTGLLEAQDDIYWPCRGRSFFLEILFFLWRRPSPEASSQAISPSRRVQDWLRLHYAEKISVARLAELFATNRTTLQERFRCEFGTSVMDALGEIRAEAASILMRNTELTLSEIGERVGFPDYSNFYREFSRRRGLAPSSYRKKAATARIY